MTASEQNSVVINRIRIFCIVASQRTYMYAINSLFLKSFPCEKFRIPVGAGIFHMENFLKYMNAALKHVVS